MWVMVSSLDQWASLQAAELQDGLKKRIEIENQESWQYLCNLEVLFVINIVHVRTACWPEKHVVIWVSVEF